MQNKLIIKLFLIFSLVCNNSFAYTIFYYSYYDNLIINTNKINNNPITTNTTTITTDYNETTIANKLTSNNINIRTGNNLNSVSTIINDTTIDTVDTLMNLNNIKLDIGNGIGIAVAEEKHEHEHIHDTWGGDIGRAALGGAITGLASGIGIKGGEFLGKLAGNAFSDLVSSTLSKSTTQVLTASVNASVNAATMSTMNTVGTAMANTTIYGGNFKDVLKSGRDSLRNKDNLKSIAVSTLGAGITSGLSKYIDGASGGVISRGTMQGASFKDQTFSALLENGLSNSVNVALESSINGDSFKESLKRQGLNMLSGTIETLGAKYIGNNYHNNEFSDNKVINKTTQLTLHAGLGAITSKISGGDYLNGAVSGVVGELTAELIGEKYYDGKDSLTDKQMENITNISGLVAGLSSIIVSKSQGQDIEDITTNAYVGQRIGQTVSKNNYLLKTGQVEEGDTLKSITKEINDFYGTNLTEEDLIKINDIADKNNLTIGEVIAVGTIDKDGKVWIPTYNKDEIDINYLKENMKGEKEKILNYHRFVFEDNDLPQTRKELLEKESNLWKGGKIAPAHNVGTSGNIEYRGVDKRSGQQIIFDKDGNIVTTPENKGTYDYIIPKFGSYGDHNRYDVNPWIKYGNSANDTTTSQQRRDGLRESSVGKIGNTIWGN